MPIIYNKLLKGGGLKVPKAPKVKTRVHAPAAPKFAPNKKWVPPSYLPPTQQQKTPFTGSIAKDKSNAAINFNNMKKTSVFSRVGQRYRSIKKGMSNGAKKVSNAVTTGTKTLINGVAIIPRFVYRVGKGIAIAPGQAAYRTYDYLKKGRLEAIRANAQDKLIRLGNSNKARSTNDFKAKLLAFQMADTKLTLHKEETADRNKLVKNALFNKSSLFANGSSILDKKNNSIKTPSLTNMLTGRKRTINNRKSYANMANGTQKLSSLDLARAKAKQAYQEHMRETNKTKYSIINNTGTGTQKNKHTIDEILNNPKLTRQYYDYLQNIGPKNFNVKHEKIWTSIREHLQVEQYKKAQQKDQNQHKEDFKSVLKGITVPQQALRRQTSGQQDTQRILQSEQRKPYTSASASPVSAQVASPEQMRSSTLITQQQQQQAQTLLPTTLKAQIPTQLEGQLTESFRQSTDTGTSASTHAQLHQTEVAAPAPAPVEKQSRRDFNMFGQITGQNIYRGTSESTHTNLHQTEVAASASPVSAPVAPVAAASPPSPAKEQHKTSNRFFGQKSKQNLEREKTKLTLKLLNTNQQIIKQKEANNFKKAQLETERDALTKILKNTPAASTKKNTNYFNFNKHRTKMTKVNRKLQKINKQLTKYSTTSLAAATPASSAITPITPIIQIKTPEPASTELKLTSAAPELEPAPAQVTSTPTKIKKVLKKTPNLSPELEELMKRNKAL